ncbi:MAG: efflux RND transporter periplasmic adaptor subunit, partial [Elusimicrobia bacterium]|nr:efflux RND transporter periplasmic adaptor subunit [Elusimicrobiota bacterium]
SAGDPLFNAAQTLLLTGKVPAGGASLIRDGQWLTYWAKGRPKDTFRMQVENFALDHPGRPQDSAGTFAMDMTPGQYLPPGTAWEGFIIPVDHPNALLVPTAAVVEFDGETFIPLRISTGITTSDWTEIAAGAVDHQDYLLLKSSQLGKAVRHELRKPAPTSAGASSQQPPAVQSAPQQEQQPDYGGDIYVQ